MLWGYLDKQNLNCALIFLGEEVRKNIKHNSKRRIPPCEKRNRGEVLKLFQRREKWERKVGEVWTKVHG